MVRTQFRPCGLCHRPYTNHSYLHVYARLLLCVMLVLASLVLGYPMIDALRKLDLVWLHPTPMKLCVGLLYAYPSIFVPHDAMLTMFVYATNWLSMHLYTLAYMSMHESCLLVCCPCFNTMKIWTPDPNLHLSPMDTTFCLPFACLSSFLLLVCLFAFLLFRLFVYLVACHVSCHMLCLPYLSCLFALYPLCIYTSLSFCCLSASFLSLPLHVHIWSEDIWSEDTWS